MVDYRDLTKGTRIKIDTAPLIASPVSTGNIRGATVIIPPSGPDDRIYVAPDGDSCMYITRNWVKYIESNESK